MEKRNAESVIMNNATSLKTTMDIAIPSANKLPEPRARPLKPDINENDGGGRGVQPKNTHAARPPNTSDLSMQLLKKGPRADRDNLSERTVRNGGRNEVLALDDEGEAYVPKDGPASKRQKTRGESAIVVDLVGEEDHHADHEIASIKGVAAAARRIEQFRPASSDEVDSRLTTKFKRDARVMEKVILNTKDCVKETSRGFSPLFSDRNLALSSSDIRPSKSLHTEQAQDNDRHSPLADPTFVNSRHDSGFVIASFSSTYYVKIKPGGSLQLRYLSGSETKLVLCQHGMPEITPGGQTVELTYGQIQTILWSPGKPHIYVTGSRTSTSNGQICILFEKWEDAKEFMDHMFGRRVNSRCVSADELSKIFSKQSREMSSDYEKRIAREEASRKAECQRQNPVEEGIRHESDMPYQRPSVTRGNKSNSFDPPRKKTRKSSSKVQSPSLPLSARWTEVNKPKRWTRPVTFPPTGLRQATVDFEDLQRLDEGELFNDNIVSFALKRIEEGIAPEHRDSIHFFNSFFYTSLMKSNGKVGFKYDAVQRWTKSKDLFTVPFIVVPINLNLHWLVAIICNLPNLKTTMDNGSDADLDVDDARKKGRRKSAPMRRYGTDTPAIITLDSFGLSRTPQIQDLKKYLVHEAERKRSMSIDRDELIGITAENLPEQNNYCDCGAFLVGYVQQFARDPKGFVDKVLSEDESLSKDFAGFSASRTREEIRDALLDLSSEAAAHQAVTKNVKTQGKNGEESTLNEYAAKTSGRSDVSETKMTKKSPKATSTAPACCSL